MEEIQQSKQQPCRKDCLDTFPKSRYPAQRLQQTQWFYQSGYANPTWSVNYCLEKERMLTQR